MNFFVTVSFYDRARVSNLELRTSKLKSIAFKKIILSKYLLEFKKKGLLSVHIPKLSCQGTVIWNE